MEIRHKDKVTYSPLKSPCSEPVCRRSPVDYRRPQVSNPGPTAQVAIDLMEKWKKQEGKSGPGVPNHIQDEAWDIAFHPTKVVQLLSRKGNPIGVSRTVVKEPSFLKKAKS